MPNPITYAKAIENISCASVNATYFNLAFDVKENWNDTTLTYDSYNTYSYYLSKVGTTMLLNVNLATGLTEEVEVKCNDLQVAFRQGEYQDIANNVPLDLGAVYGIIAAVIFV